jgi:hypothetical protein
MTHYYPIQTNLSQSNIQSTHSDCSDEYESDSSDYHNKFEKHSKQNGPDKIKQDESKPTIPRRIWSDSDSFEYE